MNSEQESAMDTKFDSREDPAFMQKLNSLGAATLYEAQGKIGAMDNGIKPIDPAMRVAGRALTVSAHPGDNLVIHCAVANASPGDVLVIDAQGYTEAGLWGDVLTEAALEAGIVGLIVDGAVRDSDEICKLNFSVFSRALSIKGTSKVKGGTIGSEIVCAGATVKCGDIVVGDRDGVVVLASQTIESVLIAAQQRETDEEKIREGLRHGKNTLELMDLTDCLKRAGLE